MGRYKLNLATSAWEHLQDILVGRVLEDYADARPGYTGRGERDHGIGFVVGSDINVHLRLAAALADAWQEVDALIECAADGFGVDDFLRDAKSDSMGVNTIIYFPGHKAQAF